MRDFIRNSLEHWSLASKNRIQFYEINPGLFSKGIFFFLAGSSEHFEKTLNVSAFVDLLYDHNHQISSAYVFLPNDNDAWNKTKLNAYHLKTWSHEIGHALGLRHLHEISSTKSKLQITRDGAYCSVMPYYDEIQSHYSMCYRNCNPPYAIHPGPLDIRMLNLSYLGGMTATLDTPRLALSYLINIEETLFLSSLMTLIYSTLQDYFLTLAFNKDHKLFSDNMAIFLADSTMLAISYFLDYSSISLALFTATATIKYFPKRSLNTLINENAQSRSISDYSIYILNCVRAIELGQKPIPMLLSIMTSLFCTRTLEFDSLGLWLARLTNRIPQAITSRFCEDISEQSAPSNQIQTQNTHHQPIAEIKPISFAKRLCTWFQRKEPAPHAENHEEQSVASSALDSIRNKPSLSKNSLGGCDNV